MQVFRLARKKYTNKLSGIGAAKSVNRWNSKGVEIIYTAQSRALAMAEVAVHLSLAVLPNDFEMIEIEIPKIVTIKEISKIDLVENWNMMKNSYLSQQIGDNFIHSKQCCVLKAPSAVVKCDFNYLLNPNHKYFKKIKITNSTDFPFDKRLF